jgi:hypothetical protein
MPPPILWLSLFLAVPPKAPSSPPAYVARPVASAREARSIAEAHTGGLAVSARKVPLNGSTGGWEVDVHMPREERGWRCLIDADARSVHTRTRIANPPPPRPHR